MIVVRLAGGLGNQMFQYAFGRAMAIRKNTSLYLDVTGFNNKQQQHTYRKFALAHFDIKATVISGTLRSYQRPVVGYIAAILNPFLKKKLLKRVIEKQFQHDADLNLSAGSLYLIGYWNSPAYFNAFAENIRTDFSFNIKLNDSGKQLAEKIRAAVAVSLHIRRGDYISNPEANAYHGICNMDYYARAVTIMLEKYKTAVFFIFTDDVEWVKQHFSINAPFVIASNVEADDGIQDMYLMGLCQHAIIANSTYSWWAAWLISNKDKTVIAPLKWYNDTVINTTDLIPASWISI